MELRKEREEVTEEVSAIEAIVVGLLEAGVQVGLDQTESDADAIARWLAQRRAQQNAVKGKQWVQEGFLPPWTKARNVQLGGEDWGEGEVAKELGFGGGGRAGGAPGSSKEGWVALGADAGSKESAGTEETGGAAASPVSHPGRAEVLDAGQFSPTTRVLVEQADELESRLGQTPDAAARDEFQAYWRGPGETVTSADKLKKSFATAPLQIVGTVLDPVLGDASFEGPLPGPYDDLEVSQKGSPASRAPDFPPEHGNAAFFTQHAGDTAAVPEATGVGGKIPPSKNSADFKERGGGSKKSPASPSESKKISKSSSPGQKMEKIPSPKKGPLTDAELEAKLRELSPESLKRYIDLVIEEIDLAESEKQKRKKQRESLRQEREKTKQKAREKRRKLRGKEQHFREENERVLMGRVRTVVTNTVQRSIQQAMPAISHQLNQTATALEDTMLNAVESVGAAVALSPGGSKASRRTAPPTHFLRF